MKGIKFFFTLVFLMTFQSVKALEPGHNIELGVAYQEAQLENKDRGTTINYGGLMANVGFNYMLTKGNHWHSYLGIQGEYSSKDNNSNNSSQSEKATFLSPGIKYGLHYKKLWLGLGYDYIMAESEGTGAGVSTIDYEIHRATLRIGLDYQMSENLFVLGSYRYGYGLTSGLSDDHIYSEHNFGINLVFRFGESKNSSSRANQSKKRTRKKRSKLFDFFDVY